MLEAVGVEVTIGSARILQAVDLTFRPGELVAIVGPNGAGKSTLLHVLSGERRPSLGSVLLDDRPLRHWKARALARRRAVLPQASSLQFHFTVAEVVALGYRVHDLAGRTRSRRQMVDAVLAELDIAHLCDRFVPTLSGGERQRVHFARCLAQLSVSTGDAARILLLDEPTSSLDPAHQHHVMARAQQMAREGGIVVAVVHDLNLAAAYADRLIVLHHGRVDFFGSATDGLSVERLARVFKIEARLLNHPAADRPLVVPLGPTGSSSGSADVEEDRVRAG